MQAVPAQMTVPELKAALSAQGLAVSGNKGILVVRLEQAQAAAAGLTYAFGLFALTAAVTVLLLLSIMHLVLA